MTCQLDPVASYSSGQFFCDYLMHFPLHCGTSVMSFLFYRILEMGFGKEIEEILTLLGSRQSGTGSEDAVPRNSIFQRQNLLLSATLNDKVNQLAKISLENPVMIGLEENGSSSRLPCSSHNLFGSIGSKVNGEIKCPATLASVSSEDYNLPVQLVQRYVKGE